MNNHNAVNDMIRQYENGMIDTSSQEATEQRFVSMPEGIRFPQNLEEEIGSGVSSLVIYEGSPVMGGYNVELLCSSENGPIFMHLWLLDHPGEQNQYIVYAVSFAPN